MISIRVAKSRILQAVRRNNFLSFFQWCFHVLESGSTLNMNWHHEAIAYHLELVLLGVIKRLIIAAPPRTLKSLMASVALEPWTPLILPAIAEKEALIPIGSGRDPHPRRVGDLLHPNQQSREFLEALKLQDPETYAAQYQQSPIPPGGFLIKRDQIQFCIELPRRTSSSVYIQSWDTAQKPGETNARSACLDILIQGQ